MKPVKFNGMNTSYGADGCEALPACVEKDPDSGQPVITSVWQPSEEDLKALNEGGCICLSLYGIQPPVGTWAQKIDILLKNRHAKSSHKSAVAAWVRASARSELRLAAGRVRCLPQTKFWDLAKDVFSREGI